MAYKSDRRAGAQLPDGFDRRPVPTVNDYEIYLAGMPKGARKFKSMSAAQIRRMVIMKRQSCSFVDIGTALGKSSVSVSEEYQRLPDNMK